MICFPPQMYRSGAVTAVGAVHPVREVDHLARCRGGVATCGPGEVGARLEVLTAAPGPQHTGSMSISLPWRSYSRDRPRPGWSFPTGQLKVAQAMNRAGAQADSVSLSMPPLTRETDHCSSQSSSGSATTSAAADSAPQRTSGCGCAYRPSRPRTAQGFGACSCKAASTQSPTGSPPSPTEHPSGGPPTTTCAFTSPRVNAG